MTFSLFMLTEFATLPEVGHVLTGTLEQTEVE
jgi:hypothetical protein